MSTKLFERCINEAATITNQVFFHVLGEPTLHPKFSFFLKKLEEVSNLNEGKPLQLTLTTNGTTIAKNSKVILDSHAVRQVNFSTHAYAELSQDDAAEKLQNVLEFCRTANVLRPDLYINLRLWNVGDASSDAWNQYLLQEVNKAFGASITLEHFCSRHKSIKICGRIYLHQDSRFEWPKLDAKKNFPLETKNESDCIWPQGTCRALDTHVAILHDGRVVACCLDYSGQITLGHIQEQTLPEILSNKTAINIREGFAQHELRHPFCQSCTFCKRFK